MDRKRTNLILLIIVVTLSVIAYWGGLSNLVTRWNTQEEYGHAYFIPLIAIWFLWNRKDALINSVGQPNYSGPLLIMLGVIGLLLGEMTAIFVLIQFGFILTLLGSVLACGGISLLRVSILPIAILLFAIPLPYFIDAQLSWRLQIVSSQLGVSLLRFLGHSVYLEGNVIDLGAYKLQVVEACSGLRYLYPLLSIGFLMAYMYKGKWWQKIIIFFSTIPITVLMNSVRIAMVGVLVNRWGTEQAEGFVHYFEGWVIFMACLFILVIEIKVFERLGNNRSFNTAVDVPKINPVLPRSKKENLYPQCINIMIVIMAIIFVNDISNRQEVQPKREELVSFPLEMSGWKAKVSSLEDNVLDTLKLDDYFIADYKHKDIGVVNFYIAYYASQRKGASPHSPSVCIPGGGWVISSLDEINVLSKTGHNYPVNRVVINKDNFKQIVYYWFEQRGRHITNQYAMKWYLLLDSIKRNRSDGSLVRLTTAVKPNESLDDAEKRVQAFLEVSAPELSRYVPN